MLNSNLSRIVIAVASLPLWIGSVLNAQSSIGGGLEAPGPSSTILEDFPNPSTNGSPLSAILTGADGTVVDFSASGGSQQTPPPPLLSPALGTVWSAANSPELFAGVSNAPEFAFYQASTSIRYTFEVVSTASTPINVTLTGTNIAYVSQVGNNFNSTVIGMVSPTATVGGSVDVSTTPAPSNSFPNNVDLVYDNFSNPPGTDFNPIDNSAALLSSLIETPINDTFSVVANLTYYVNLSASVGSFPSGSGSAFDYVDPILTLDPTFLEDNPGAQIVVSSGFSNLPPTVPGGGSSVPEAGNTALLSTFGVISLMILRQRNFLFARSAG